MPDPRTQTRPHPRNFALDDRRLRPLHGLAVGFAVLALVALGVVPGLGIAQGGRGRAMTDFEYFYAAGACLNAGENPYDQPTFSRRHEQVTGEPTATHFYYPPQFGPWCMLFASVSFNAARFIIIALNVAGAIAIAFVAWRMAAGSARSNDGAALMRAGTAAACFALAYPGTARLIEVGQASLIAGGLVILSWCFAKRGEPGSCQHSALSTQHSALSTQHSAPYTTSVTSGSRGSCWGWPRSSRSSPSRRSRGSC
jgi:hypothetical protein